MLGKTHFAGGIVAGSLVAAIMGNPVIGMGVGAISALLPDIDEPHSVIGRRFPLLAWPVRLIFGHRTVTHTVEFSLAISVLVGILTQIWLGNGLFIGLCVFMGMVSHILLDSFTPSGIQPFFFLPWHPKGPFKTGNLLEIPFGLVLLLVALKIGHFI